MSVTRAFGREVHRAFRDRSGATAIEYSLICALVFFACAVGVGVLGDVVLDTYNNIATSVDNAIT